MSLIRTPVWKEEQPYIVFRCWQMGFYTLVFVFVVSIVVSPPIIPGSDWETLPAGGNVVVCLRQLRISHFSTMQALQAGVPGHSFQPSFPKEALVLEVLV